mmetsp:Transcript_16313/g.43974  ORF Transcript_16313/g.43974 Transcript_16313/m.43974 type:complete len:226 (+) Transcript_16313:56-733(+)
MRCYNCGEQGHAARDCANAAPTCYSCGEVGHVSRDCPTAIADPQLTDPNFIYQMALNSGLEERKPHDTAACTLSFMTQTGISVDVVYSERSIKASADNGATWRTSGYHSVESLERLLAKPRANSQAAPKAATGRTRATGRTGTTGKACWNCGSTEHLSRDCPNPPNEEAEANRPARKPARGQRCFNCGETGHIASECAHKNLGPKCYRCSQYGHIGRDCPVATEG